MIWTKGEPTRAGGKTDGDYAGQPRSKKQQRYRLPSMAGRAAQHAGNPRSTLSKPSWKYKGPMAESRGNGTRSRCTALSSMQPIRYFLLLRLWISHSRSQTPNSAMRKACAFENEPIAMFPPKVALHSPHRHNNVDAQVPEYLAPELPAR